jgi:phosphate:Na+ symporter
VEPGRVIDLQAFGATIGGLGLFLLGMGLMTDGLKLAAGPALHRTLLGATRTRAQAISLPRGDDPAMALAQLGIGLLMTVLTQSSSAAMAITLTAAQGGLIEAQGAAAVVIGANIGTTVTALLAAVAATPNARRAASAHVVFNLLTGLVALLLLPWLIRALALPQQALGLPPDPATALALFHTMFNLIGVLLMWPLAARLTRELQRRFRAREEDEAQPRFLDDTVLAVPTLALDALAREMARAGQVARRMIGRTLDGADATMLKADHAILASLGSAIDGFVERLRSASMPQAASVRLATLLRIQRHHEAAAEQALAAAALPPLPGADAALAEAWSAFEGAARALVHRCDSAEAADVASADRVPGAMEARYEDLKAALLAAGADGRLALTDMEQALRRSSALRRAAWQASRGSTTRS